MSRPADTPRIPDEVPGRRHTFREKTLHAFVVDGRLVRVPARERKRQVILRWIAMTDFGPDRAYPEREVDMRLALRHRDVAALRRSLVDSRYLSRADGVYRLRPEADWPADPDADIAPSVPSPEE
jgi:hypothetical protein